MFFRPDVRPYRMANCRVPSMLDPHFLHQALREVPGQRCPSQTTQAVCKACLLALFPAAARPPLVTKASQLGSGGENVVWGRKSIPYGHLGSQRQACSVGKDRQMNAVGVRAGWRLLLPKLHSFSIPGHVLHTRLLLGVGFGVEGDRREELPMRSPVL